jgi:hypothetical protein
VTGSGAAEVIVHINLDRVQFVVAFVTTIRSGRHVIVHIVARSVILSIEIFDFGGPLWGEHPLDAAASRPAGRSARSMGRLPNERRRNGGDDRRNGAIRRSACPQQTASTINKTPLAASPRRPRTVPKVIEMAVGSRTAGSAASARNGRAYPLRRVGRSTWLQHHR